MSRYKAGREREYRVANKLRRAGFTVTRASGSHSPFDLIAYNEVSCLHIQVKSRHSMSEFRKLPRLAPGCLVVLVYRNGHTYMAVTEFGELPFDEFLKAPALPNASGREPVKHGLTSPALGSAVEPAEGGQNWDGLTHLLPPHL